MMTLEVRVYSANDIGSTTTSNLTLNRHQHHGLVIWLLNQITRKTTFSTISPFAINKALLGIAGEMKTVRKLSNGDLMVETTKRPHSENLLKCNNFINFPVTVTPHRSLNSSRGIIRHREFKFCSDEEVQENLSSKGVTDVKRISVTRDGTKQPTNTFILTFNVSTPTSIH